MRSSDVIQVRESINATKDNSEFTDISKAEQDHKGLFKRATKTDNKKCGIAVCIILSILLIVLIVLYFKIDSSIDEKTITTVNGTIGDSSDAQDETISDTTAE